MTLEFIVATKAGSKAYESAIEADTNAVNFNVALLLTGLDPLAHVCPVRSSTRCRQPATRWRSGSMGRRGRWPAAGTGRAARHQRAEKRTMPEGGRVYTGARNVVLTEADGVLIGFVHSPALAHRESAPAGQGSLRIQSFQLGPRPQARSSGEGYCQGAAAHFTGCRAPMTRHLAGSILVVGALAGGTASARAQSLSLNVDRGRVTIDARNVSVAQILERWARAGRITIVNVDQIPAGLVTVQFNNAREIDVLATLLDTPLAISWRGGRRRRALAPN